jgi:hypothetical protein
LPRQVTNPVARGRNDKNCQQQTGAQDTNRHSPGSMCEIDRKTPAISGWHAPC